MLISERHVLTAAHVVRCPDHPTVHVVLYDGRRVRMHVERDDQTFGAGADLARLVSVGSLRRFIAPPTLGASDGINYVIARRSGTVTGDRRQIAARFGPGDSGAGVYSPAGLLVGLLTGGSDGDIQIERVTQDWIVP